MITIKKVCMSSILLHILFIVIGTSIHYTDIDYKVFSDASIHVIHGKSPYLRATYRYSPILFTFVIYLIYRSYLLIPNILFPSFGKVLFSCFDILCGLCIFAILKLNGQNEDKATKLSTLWLWNPYVIIISTRGSCDSIECFLVFYLLFLLQKKRIWEASIIYGISVHFRIYPIIYCLTFVLYCYYQTKRKWMFSLVSSGTFILLFIVFTLLYGMDYIKCCYLHHLWRIDMKHNYSIYFYSFYLQHFLHFIPWLPQIILLSLISLLLHTHLLICVFLLTWIFVTFNKVITAQYMMWWLSLGILVIPYSSLSYKKLALLCFLFLLSMNCWNGVAYYLEFYGNHVFLDLWLQCLLFLLVQVYCISTLIKSFSRVCYKLYP